MLKFDKNIKLSPPKIVILGASETGKSTLFTHMRWESMENKEKRHYCFIPLINAIRALSTVVTTAERKFNFAVDPAYQSTLALVEQILNHADIMPSYLLEQIKYIWNDRAIQLTLALRHEHPYYLQNDDLEFYMNKLVEISSPDYSATLDDVLRMRMRTTGIIELLCPISSADVQVARARYPPASLSFPNPQLCRFRILDFGGRRSERRRWVYGIDDVNEVVFCTSLAEYVLPLVEDATKNRMHESLILLSEVTHSRWLIDVPLILLFTKVDIFRQLLPFHHLQKCFPDYSGHNEYQEVLDFIIDKFVHASGKNDKEVNVIVTNLLDIPTMKDVVSFIKGHALYSYFTKKPKPKPTTEKSKKKKDK